MMLYFYQISIILYWQIRSYLANNMFALEPPHRLGCNTKARRRRLPSTGLLHAQRLCVASTSVSWRLLTEESWKSVERNLSYSLVIFELWIKIAELTEHT